MTAAVCAVGPVTVTRLPDTAARGDVVRPALVHAAIDGGDGRFVLVGDDPTPLRQVWMDSLRPLLDGADRAVLIHPSWWTAPRAEVMRTAVAELVGDVELMSRSAVLRLRHPTAAVVEIAPHAVLVVVDGVPVSSHQRSSPPDEVSRRVADALRSTGRDLGVVVDAPEQVPGADVLAASISAAVSQLGMRIWLCDDRQLVWAATTHRRSRPSPVLRVGKRSRWPAAMLTVGLVAVVLGAGLFVAPVGRRSAPAPAPVTALVEGRVTMQIPAHWIVRRVTDGPGSARVQVISPSDPDAVLHLTQSRLVDTDLAATATVLRRAMDAEPPGTFVDFDPADQRAGRMSVTYREIRPGREIVWTVLVDGDVRMSIGCQGAVGRSIAVAAACDDAVRTAQKLR